MPPAARRRRPAQDESSEEERSQPTRHQRRPPPSDDEEAAEDDDEDAGEDENMDVDERSDSHNQQVKKMVRYALACEYQRTTIKRNGITEKVIGKERGSFKRVFDAAQDQLRSKFGMEMVELPVREKLTMREKKAAQKSKGTSKPTASYILTSILPTEYKIPAIMPPSIIGSAEEEAAYMGLCSVIVSIIALSANGTLGDSRLRQHLNKMNLEHNTGIGKTEDVLKKMINQGYVQKIVEKNSDEETIDWIVGPRGKVEIATKDIRGLVLEVYGDNASDDLDRRLQRSLGMELKVAVQNGAGTQRQQEQPEGEDEDNNGDPGPSNTRRTSGRRR